MTKYGTTARFESGLHQPPKDFLKNDFSKLNMLPKMGVPVALVELAYPSEEWAKKKGKKNAIRVIFQDHVKLTYADTPMKRINKQGTTVDLYEHISSCKGRYYDLVQLPIQRRKMSGCSCFGHLKICTLSSK